MAQLMPLPLAVSCFSKIQIGFTFLYRLTWVVADKGPLTGVCVCVCVCGGVKIYALKPFEADIGYVSAVDSTAPSNMAAAGGGRGTTDDVIVAPADARSANCDTKV